MTSNRITRISIAPIKGFSLRHPSEINLTFSGAEGDRAFFLVDDQDFVVSVTRTGNFAGFVPSYCPSTNELEVTAPDGSSVRGEVTLGECINANFWGHHKTPARIVTGPWARWFSRVEGQNVRLVKALAPSGGTDLEPVTLLGAHTVEALREHAGLEYLDQRRFRMLFSFSGGPAHVEDSWADREFQIGSARVLVKGLVKRCAAVTRDPTTGDRDLPLLRVMKRHRGLHQSALGMGVCLGVYAAVTTPGTVRVGDVIAALDSDAE